MRLKLDLTQPATDPTFCSRCARGAAAEEEEAAAWSGPSGGPSGACSTLTATSVSRHLARNT